MPENNIYYLYEYQNTEKLDVKDEYINKLEKFLDDIWKRRDKNDSQYTNNDEPDTSTQQFLSLLRNNQIKQKNYVGVINFDKKTFNLLPKIFNDGNDNSELSDNELKKINLNILWWLTYTTKIKFPKNLTSLDKLEKHSFLEVMIWLFATYTKETLNNNLYQNYIDVEDETTFVKGQFMFNEYINQHLARARWDKVYCRYDSFEFDNYFNRIIKYVSNQLLNFTSNAETKRYLQDIVFILSEVSDERFTIEDCRKVKLNHFQNEFETILEYCKLFLANSITLNYHNNLNVFAFLIPMEKLFEEFVFGFIEKEFKDVTNLKIEKQASGVNLTEQNGYQLKPDLKISYNGKEYLADTKYKIIHDSDKKLSQNDLYQMVAYAIRYECKDIMLFYPKYYEKLDMSKLEIVDMFSGTKINIHPHQLPIKINEYKNDLTFQQNFAELKKLLKCKIEKAIKNEIEKNVNDK